MSKAKNLLQIEFTQEICHELLPEWQGLDVNISTLSGGITNKLYRIQSEKGDYTVRIYGDKTDLFIDRDNEAHTIQEMAETVKKVVGFKGQLVFDASKPDGTMRKLMDVSRINAMGWKASISLEQGLKSTYLFYNQNS